MIRGSAPTVVQYGRNSTCFEMIMNRAVLVQVTEKENAKKKLCDFILLTSHKTQNLIIYKRVTPP
jgi:hypothetical protein